MFLGPLFRIFKRSVVIFSFVGLIASNVLSVTSAGFNEALHSALSLIPNTQILKHSPVQKQRQLKSERNALIEERKKIKAAHTAKLEKINEAHRAKLTKAREISRRIATRTARNLGVNIASMTTEVIPYIGAATIFAVTAMDVKDGCDTVSEVNEMINTFEGGSDSDQINEVCGISIPSLNYVMAQAKDKVTKMTQHTKTKTVKKARAFKEKLGGTIYELLH